MENSYIKLHTKNIILHSVLSALYKRKHRGIDGCFNYFVIHNNITTRWLDIVPPTSYQEVTVLDVLKERYISHKDFEVGKFYRCIKADVSHEKWEGIVVTKAPNNKVYPIYHEDHLYRDDFVEYISYYGGDGLCFSYSYLFEEIKCQ